MKDNYKNDILNKELSESEQKMNYIDNEDMDYKLYVLAELAYTKENSEINEEELFPIDWYSIKNYRLKVEMIGEALKNKCLIKDTKQYQDNIKGIKLQK